MKLALINPISGEGDPPLGLAYLASYIRKYNNSPVEIVIIDNEDPIKRIKKENPDVIGITSMTCTFPQVNKLAGEIKSRWEDIPLLIGGIHISSMPEHLADSNFDIGIIGEGEQTLLELVQLYEKYGGFPKDKLKKIDGIVFKYKERSYFTRPRALIEPIDAIPFPARDLLKMKDYYLVPRLSGFGKFGIYVQMITSRGCPYKCVFCSPTTIWKKPRFHSAEYVIEEIKHITNEYDIDGIHIWDDLFIANIERLRKLVKLIKENKIELEFLVFGRANLINREVCKLLKQMNVVAINFGLESGSDKILRYLKGNTVTVADNKRAIKLCKEFGIKTIGTFIIGSPDETEEDLKQTMELVKDKNLDNAHIFQLTPLPNTGVWEYAKKIGLVSDTIDFDYSKLAVRGFKPELLMTKKIGKEKFREFYFEFQKVAEKKNSRINLNSIKSFKFRYIKYFINKRFVTKILKYLKIKFYAKFKLFIKK